MKTQAKVNRNGSVTIPIETRQALGGLNEGDIINIDVEIARRVGDKS